jgi:cullin 1
MIIYHREYYSQQGESWMAEDTTPSYLKRVEQILLDELQRVNSYLLPSTEMKLATTLEVELLAKRITPLLERESSGCKAMLIQELIDDLSRLYRLFSKVINGLEPVAEIFKQYVLNLGQEKIADRLSRLESNSSSSSTTAAGLGTAGTVGSTKEKEEVREGNDDPQYLKEMLEVHDKAIYLVTECFQSNSLFQKALKDAFVELINQDTGKYKSADLIATFVDRLLKKNGSEKMSDEEIEQFLEKSVTLFSYLSDKDLFADIYRHQLAKRLLQQRSASDDMERLMISKLKLRCGAQFTAKMEGMLNDLKVSTETADSFDIFLRDHSVKYQLGRVEFGVQVLTAGHWPQYKPYNEIHLPPIMFRCVNAFQEYYDMKTNHRRLLWTYSLGNIFMKGNFQNKKSFEIQVTTLQAVIMLAFNADSLAGAAGGPLSYQTLLDNTNLPEDALKKVLHSLSCGKFKILKRIIHTDEATTNPNPNSAIRNTDSFQFNDSFK